MKLLEAQKQLESIKKVKISFTALGNALGLSRQRAFQIQDCELKTEQLKQIESFFSVDLLQNAELCETSSENIQEPEELVENNDVIMIDILNIKCAAGGGVLNYETEVIGQMPMPKSIVGKSAKNKKMLTVSGDSMHPTIDDQDSVVIDLNAIDIIDNKIYVICTSVGTIIKRLRVTSKGLMIISDNKDYETELVQGQEVIKIVGRVIAHVRKM